MGTVFEGAVFGDGRDSSPTFAAIVRPATLHRPRPLAALRVNVRRSQMEITLTPLSPKTG